jgi:hypothetical protein
MLHVLLVSRLTRWGLAWKLTTRVLVYAALLVSRLTCLYRNCALTKDCIIRLIKDMYVFIGKMPLRRKTTRLNAEDLLIILQQYNLFPIVASLNYKIYQCFYGRTKQHCCNVNPGPWLFLLIAMWMCIVTNEKIQILIKEDIAIHFTDEY